MAHDRKQIEQLARTYTDAWCSHDVGRIADHYVPGGEIVFNGRERVGIEEAANYFVAAFPDGEIFMDDLVLKGDAVEWHWTLTGTRAETGKRVRISGYEEWTIGADGLIAESHRHYDEAEYERQLQPLIVRPHRSEDFEAAKHIYTEAFRRPESPDTVPLEVPLFEALAEAGDFLPELSFTALLENEAVGHVTASKGTVASDDSVVAVGPIGVLPEHQNIGIGSALMDALLSAADAAHVPLVVLLGSPQYYSRFGFRPAELLGVTSPEPAWGDAFQARPLTAYTSLLAGPFRYAPAFSP